MREARALAARGVREIILISQDTTFYGRDPGHGAALPQLLRELNEVEGIDWIRLLYLYPTTITDDILDAMAECDKVCKYIDLPLQHASDDVLRRMKRPGTGRSYERLLANIRARVPGVALRTTFIVGFPGETEAEFEELCAFVRTVGFDHVGVFTYSHEEGTTAYDLADDVPAAVKTKRRNRLMAEQKKDRRAGPAAARRRDGAGAGGRPLARARAGLARPAGGTGAGHRSGRLFHRGRSGGAAAGQLLRGRNRGLPRLRPAGPTVNVATRPPPAFCEGGPLS